MKYFSLSRATLGALVALGSSTIVAACGGGQPQADSAAQQSTEATPPAQQPSIPFDEMSSSEKMKHMKNVVKPHMAKVFQEADAKAYADFACTTCHGPGARQGNFEMPTDSLPKLDDEEMAEHPEVTQFMIDRVVPEMATLLGEQPYNQETQTGFGCFDCHMKKE